MKFLNAVADFLGPPTSFRHAMARQSAFIICASIVVVAAHHTDTAVTIGAVFGYAWGSLTTYGTMRQRAVINSIGSQHGN